MRKDSAENSMGKIKHVCKPDADLFIDAPFRGVICCKRLIIKEKASVYGRIVADEVRVYGKAQGIMDTEKLFVSKNGKAFGKITYGGLVVEFGGVVEGSVRSENDHLIDRIVAEAGAFQDHGTASIPARKPDCLVPATESSSMHENSSTLVKPSSHKEMILPFEL